MNFDKLFEQIENSIKIGFLKDLLTSDKALRKKFLESIPVVVPNVPAKSTNITEFTNKVNLAYKEFIKSMVALNLEEFDWEDYVAPHSGYMEEWEAYDSMAEQEIEEAYGGFENEILENLLQGNIIIIIVDFLAFYRAATDVRINNPFDVLEPVNDYLIETKLREWIDFTTRKMEVTHLTDNHIINAIVQFFKYFDSQKKDSAKSIHFFEYFLIALINKVSDKNAIPLLDKITSIDSTYFPGFANALIKKTGSHNDWENLALHLYITDKQVAEELLSYYTEANQHQKYIETAKKLFANNKAYWCISVQQHILAKDDSRFYVDVNLQCCTLTSKIKYYKNVKKLLSKDEKERFIEGLKYNTELKAFIFKEDGEFEKIKPLVKSLDSLWNSSEKILDTIKNVYPEFVFKKILKHINSLMTNSKRSRHTYTEIANWIKYANQIPDQREKTMKLTTKLFNHKPNLPALKDEFRKAGII